jgi:hypothetical protein
MHWGPCLAPTSTQGQAERNNALGVAISPELYIFAGEVNE